MDVSFSNNYILKSEISSKQKTRFPILCNLAMIVLLAGIEITPFLARNLSALINFLIVIIWFFSSLPVVKSDLFKNRESKRVLLLTSSIFLLEIFYCLIGLSNNSIKVYFDRLTVFVIPLMAVIVYRYYNISEKRLLLFLLLLIILCNLGSNIYLYQIDPDIFEAVTDVKSSAYHNTNAGETNFVAFIMFFSLCTLLFFANEKKPLLKIIFIGMFAISLYYIFFVNTRTTSIILFIVGFVALFLSKLKKYQLFLIIVIVISLIVILFANRDYIFDFLAKELSGTRNELRIIQLKDYLNGKTLDVDEGSFAMRLELSKISLTTFLKSPINFLFGIGEYDTPTKTYAGALLSGIGGHSQIVDCLAEYGLIGSLLFVSFYFSLFKLSLKSCPARMKRYACVIFLMFIIYSLLNKSFYGNIYYLSFLVLPLFCSCVEAR